MEIYGVTGDRMVDGILTAEEQAALETSQQEAYESVLAYWAMKGIGKPYPLVIKPTGYGKGRVIDKLIHRIASFDRDSKTLLIVGTKDVLVEQNQESLRSLVHEETGEERFSILPDTSEQVILCTWQGLNAYLRKKELANIGLVIVDEVHNIGTVRRLQLLGKISSRAVVGLTATGFRSTGEFRDPESYGFQVISDIVSTLPECIHRRWLSSLMGISIDTQVVLPREVVNNYGGLNSKVLYRELRKHPTFFSSLAKDVAQRFLPSGMKTIVVTNRVVEEACVIAEVLKDLGFKVGLAVNKRSADELQGRFVTHGAIQRYKLPHDHPDAIQVLISPHVIGEGFDAPATECIVWAGGTSSSLRYTQVMGRGARRCPGKRYCLTVDYCYLIEGYGYSMSFAQFFKRSEIKELEEGVLYVGAAEEQDFVIVPPTYTKDARLLTIVDTTSRKREVYPPMEDWVTPSMMVRALHRGYRWLTLRLEPYRHLAEVRREEARNIPRECYPPQVLAELRQLSDDEHAREGIVGAVKDAEGWLTAQQIADVLKLDWTRVKNKLIASPHEDSAEMRRGSRGIYLHYPPQALDYIRDQEAKRWDRLGVETVQEIPPADGWYTQSGIAAALGHTPKTVERLLLIHEFGSTAEVRLAANRIPAKHYPPYVKDMLEQDNLQRYGVRSLSELPSAGNWIATETIARGLGTTRFRIERRLPDCELKGEWRIASTGQPLLHYPPEILEELRVLLKRKRKSRSR